jgi:hypothetical protein
MTFKKDMCLVGRLEWVGSLFLVVFGTQSNWLGYPNEGIRVPPIPPTSGGCAKARGGVAAAWRSSAAQPCRCGGAAPVASRVWRERLASVRARQSVEHKRRRGERRRRGCQVRVEHVEGGDRD